MESFSLRAFIVLLLGSTTCVIASLSDSDQDQDPQTFTAKEHDLAALLAEYRRDVVAKARSSSSFECPQGCQEGFSYRYHRSQSCYKLITEPRAWQSAADYCQSLHCDAHLVFIESAAEQYTIQSWLETQRISDCPVVPEGTSMGTSLWIGGQRSEPSDGKTPFYWKKSGRVSLPINYTHWAGNQPDNAANHAPESCIHLPKLYNFSWNDVPCWHSSCAICEYDL